MLCDLGFFKDLVAVGIRVSLFVHEERGHFRGGTGRQLFLNHQTSLLYGVLSRLSYLTGYI